LDEINKVSENQDKINTLSTMIAEATVRYKKMRLLALEDQKIVKQSHEQVVRMEHHCKKIAGIIKEEKQK
jgi:CRISPR/Cas system CMR-associated protein Cmr5 small subunit